MQTLGVGTILVWKKRNSEGFLCNAEAAWMNTGRGVYVYSEPVEKMQKTRTHPTQKPEGLMEWCIEKASNPNDLIFDPFCGSGTTCVAAKRLGRRYIGIDISPEYCDIARKRLEAEEKGITVKELEKGQGSLFATPPQEGE
jgi:DNA modification methylase